MCCLGRLLVRLVVLRWVAGTGKVRWPFPRAVEVAADEIGFASDPYLSGALVYETVSAVQAAGVITSTKVHRIPDGSLGLANMESALHRQRAGDESQPLWRRAVRVVKH